MRYKRFVPMLGRGTIPRMTSLTIFRRRLRPDWTRFWRGNGPCGKKSFGHGFTRIDHDQGLQSWWAGVLRWCRLGGFYDSPLPRFFLVVRRFLVRDVFFA